MWLENASQSQKTWIDQKRTVELLLARASQGGICCALSYSIKCELDTFTLLLNRASQDLIDDFFANGELVPDRLKLVLAMASQQGIDRALCWGTHALDQFLPLLVNASRQEAYYVLSVRKLPLIATINEYLGNP